MENTEPTTYFHGGPQGLLRIAPPSVTGVRSLAEYGAEKVCRPDRVYLTASAEVAEFFAVFAPCRGAVCVYEVRPTSEVVPDPDCLAPGLSFEAEAADVLRVVWRLSAGKREKKLQRLARNRS